MSDWISNSLNQLVAFQKGRKVETSLFQAQGFEPYLGAGALSGKNDGYASTFLAVTANKKDVLMLWDGERSGLVGHSLSGVVSSTVCKLTPNEIIDSELLYYLLLFNFGWVQNRRTGTGVPHVPKDIGRILKLDFPADINLQRKITRILSTLDQTIEKTEALIEKYQHIKAGLMHDLFTRGIGADGKLRPPHEQAPELYHETPIGCIPKEWDLATIDTIKETLVDGPFGSNLKTEHYVSDPGVRVVRLQNIQSTKYNDEDKAFVSDKHANNLYRNKVIGNDILIAGLGEERYPVGRACLYPNDLPPAINKADCFRLRSIDGFMDNGFLMYFLNASAARTQVRKYEQGVTRPRINLGNMKKLVVPLPEMDEQINIFEKLERLAAKIGLEIDKRNKLLLEKSGLMHDLLTSKVPVRVDESELETA